MKAFCGFILLAALLKTSWQEHGKSDRKFRVDYEKNAFLKDGQPFRYISGSMHYFRIPPIYWRDRLQKMKACGIDSVETYIPWNFHSQGNSYNFLGQHDIGAFLEMVQEEGLLAIVRGFPYSDTEWDMGGLPSWLLKSKYNHMELRTSDEKFLTAVEDWFDVILPIIKPYLYNNGGPIILVQVENEYGSYYAHDGEYMLSILGGIDTRLDGNVVLFTTDGDGSSDIKYGGVTGALRTVDFGTGTNVSASFALLRKYQKNGPLVNSEFYTGWLDFWDGDHHRVSSESICATLDEMLAFGASVNFYMFTGGTNFGYWSGADGPPIKQVTTSYDYDSPISENGDTTNKYFEIRKVIAKYKGPPSVPVPPNITTFSYGNVDLANIGTIWTCLHSLCPHGPVKSAVQSFEDLDQEGGFVLYRTLIPSSCVKSSMSLFIENSVRDYATVFVNEKFVSNVRRGEQDVQLGFCEPGDRIDILVESWGRTCFGSGINDSKGMDGVIELSGHFNTILLEEWEIYPLEIENVLPAPESKESSNVPSIFQQAIILPHVADTFIDFSGGNWTSGYVVVNGFNLGKYDPVQGPQKTLYMPTKYLIKNGLNIHITIFETSPAGRCAAVGQTCPIKLVDRPILG